MEFRENIRQKFEDFKPDEPLKFFEEIRQLLKEALKKDGKCDPLKSEGAKVEGLLAYTDATRCLDAVGLPAATEALLFELWNFLSDRQKKEKRRIYRAGIALRLIEHYLKHGNRGYAYRWALHTQADDLFDQHNAGLGGQYLRTVFGMSSANLQKIETIAETCRQKVICESDWSQPEAFPEEVIRRLAKNPQTTHILVNAVSPQEFPISMAYFNAWLDRMSTSEEHADKGKILEDIAVYLALLLPGCIPLANVEDEDKTGEFDLVVRNLVQTPHLATELLGRYFLVECKNRKTPVKTRHVGYFLQHLRLTHTKFGIIFSVEGITGQKNKSASKALIRRTFHEDGNVCIVVNKEDLERLAKGEKTFWWMIVEKIEEMRFGKPKKQAF